MAKRTPWSFHPTDQTRRIIRNMAKCNTAAGARRLTHQMTRAMANDIGYLSAVRMRRTLHHGINAVARRIPPVTFISSATRRTEDSRLKGLLHDTGRMASCIGYNLEPGKSGVQRANAGPVDFMTPGAQKKVRAAAGGTMPFTPASTPPQSRSTSGRGGLATDRLMAGLMVHSAFGRLAAKGPEAMLRSMGGSELDQREAVVGNLDSNFHSMHESPEDELTNAWLRDHADKEAKAAHERGIEGNRPKIKTLGQLCWLHELGFRFKVTKKMVGYFFALANETAVERQSKAGKTYTQYKGIGRHFAKMAFSFQKKEGSSVSVPPRPFMQLSMQSVQDEMRWYFPKAASVFFSGWVVSGRGTLITAVKGDGPTEILTGKESRMFTVLGPAK